MGDERKTAMASSNLADPKLLDKIDRLFEINMGEYVDLPQLLVVGDQSSGKSSVLEALTGLPFPRDSILCTRFATQITFRRAPVDNVCVSIIPAEDAEPGYAAKLLGWKRELSSLDREVFVDILEEVCQLMDLKDPRVDTANSMKRTFSDDKLKIDILGPVQEHFSVIDVPGIFKKTTQGVTTKEDISLVRSMVLERMKNPRAVILAVVPANGDIANQEILELASSCDPEEQRTLGVFTKPDLVDRGGEEHIAKIVEGKTHRLNLGWCIVCNLGQEDMTQGNVDRNAAERILFKTKAPWNRLPKDRVGIDALRLRLAEILGIMVRREFSQVKQELNIELKDRRRQLANLGLSRNTRDQQYKFLLGLATRFQELTAFALKADYGSDDAFDKNPGLRLATAVVNRNADFSDDMFRRGHTRIFKQAASAIKSTPPAPDQQVSDDGIQGKFPVSAFAKKSKNKVKAARFSDFLAESGWEEPPPAKSPQAEALTEHLELSRRRDNGYDELSDILVDSMPISEPNSNPIIPWLTEMYKNSRGFELGTFDASLLPIVWKKQSINWDALALGYMSDIVDIVHSFTMELLGELCDDERIQKGVIAVLQENLLERYKKGMDHTRFLLSVERDGTPLTTNHYFAENLEKSRQGRVEARLEERAFTDSEGQRVVRLDTTIASTTASNLEHTIGDLHDILHSYYKVARKRFVDIVCMQAADFHLVTGPDTPIKVFSPAFVSELSDDQLEQIAGEETSTKRRRMELKRDIENLQKGKKILE